MGMKGSIRPFHLPLSLKKNILNLVSNPSLPISFLIATLLFALGFTLFRPFYLTIDDGFIGLMSQKSALQPDSIPQWLIFSNAVLDVILRALYLRVPGFPWYGFVLFSVFFLSTWGWVHLLLTQPGDFIKKMAILVFFLPLFFYYFTGVQFTTISILAAQAALILAAKAFRLRRSLGWLVLSGLLFFSAWLIRPEGFLWGVFIGIPGAAYVLWNGLGGKIHDLKKSLTFAAITVLSIAGSYGFDHFHYKNNPSWSEARAYAKIHWKTVEFRNPVATPEFVKQLNSMGWSPLDLLVYDNCFGQDPQFNLESLKHLEKISPPLYSGKGWGWLSFFKDNFILAQLFALSLLLFFIQGPKRFWILMAIPWVFSGLIYLFYFKKVVPWIAWPTFSSLVFFGLYLLISTPSRPKGLGKNWIFGVVAFLWLLFPVWTMSHVVRTNRARIEMETRLKKDLTALAPRPDQLYVLWVSGLPFEAAGVFENNRVFNSLSFYWLGGYQNTPAERQILERFKLQKLFLDMLGREDVFFILPKKFMGLYDQYMRERYRVHPEFLWTFHGETFDVYQVRKDPAAR
jgi:hypothetical protein